MPRHSFRLEKSSGFCHPGAFQLALASLAATTGVKSAAYSMGRWRLRNRWPGHSPCCVPLKSWLQCRYVSTLRTAFMATTKLSSREFNQDTSRAKRAAKRGPVFITDRGRPSHVLLTVEEYQKLTEGQKTIVDLLGMSQAAEVEFEPPRKKGNLRSEERRVG